MLHDIFLALWFLLPAGAANVAPIVSSQIPGLRRWQAPIDGGRKWHGQELLGSHKTWRGLLTGIVVATIVFWFQQRAYVHVGWVRSLTENVAYDSLPTFVLGPLFGIGALGGDSVASFFKRRRGVRSGRSWIPFDQLDYIIGAVIVTLPFVVVSAAVYAWITVLWFCIHLLSSYVGWLLGIKQQPI